MKFTTNANVFVSKNDIQNFLRAITKSSEAEPLEVEYSKSVNFVTREEIGKYVGKF